jgi:hypothetical protein
VIQNQKKEKRKQTFGASLADLNNIAAHASGLKQFWKERRKNRKKKFQKYDRYIVKSQRSVYNVRYVFTTVTVSTP